METDPLRYDKWIEDALRDVVRQALSHAALHGLPGEHHFYVTFRTDADGGQIPSYLHAEHPEEMTIVLQNQFWDLAVDETAFQVGLKFKGKTEILRIPLVAITAFADPEVNFGLQLKMLTVSEDEDAAPGDGSTAGEKDGDAKTGEVIALDSFRKK
jgi:uncharacterized protein